MMNMTDEDWQTFARKTIAYVGFSIESLIPLHDSPFWSGETGNEEKFCCLVIDKDHRWSFHFRKSLRENYSIPNDKVLLVFRGVLKEKLNDDKWKPIDSFRYEFIFDGNDISFEREIPSDIRKMQESYLRMGRL